jgi:hypothetical protein
MSNIDIRRKSGNVSVGYMEDHEIMDHRYNTTAAYKWFYLLVFGLNLSTFP